MYSVYISLHMCRLYLLLFFSLAIGLYFISVNEHTIQKYITFHVHSYVIQYHIYTFLTSVFELKFEWTVLFCI